MAIRAWVLVAAFSLSALPSWSQVPRGGEIAVNEYTTGFQRYPAIAADAAGAFTVVWEDSGNGDGSGRAVRARRFGADGQPLASSFVINTFTTGHQYSVSIASDAAGNQIVAWHSPQDGSDLGIYARRFDPSGNPVGGSEFRVNVRTTGFQQGPTVAMAGDGGFVVTWTGDLVATRTIFARRYDAAGLPTTAGDIAVNALPSFQANASVASDAAGNFVVTWQGYGSGDAEGVFARRFDHTGAPIGGEFRVNADVTGVQAVPSIAMAPAGEFMVVWNTDTGQVMGRRFEADGSPQGADFLVSAATLLSDQGQIAADPLGNFVVTWASLDGTIHIFARRYDVSGAPGPPFRVNTSTGVDQEYGAVAIAGNGDFVISWESDDDGSVHGILAQRFSSDVIFRDDFESGSLARWSLASTDGGDLAPSAFAALDFSAVGLQGVVDDTAGIFVQDDSPANEDVYRARFWFDPNTFDPGEAQNHLRTRILLVFEEAPNRRLAALVLRRQSGSYSLMGRARRDDNSQANTGFFPISDGPHAVEIAWRRASIDVPGGGEFQLWIDGVLMSTLSGLPNSISSVDFVRMGALSVKAGASGTLYWDEFESRRGGLIGP